MSWITFELRLLMRSRLSLATFTLMLTLSCLSVAMGLHEINRQQHALTRLNALQNEDVAAVAEGFKSPGEAGKAAYYTFYNTWNPPSSMAFAALGMRDVAPYAMRVRALGLHAQLYAGETLNPELALAGRFDFAFVLIYLAPLFVISLFHDLISSERQSGRLGLLLSMPGPLGRLWVRRASLRFTVILACLSVPLLVGATLSNAAPLEVAMAVVLTASYLAFWTGLSLLVASRRWHSTTQAIALMATWVTLTLVLPTLANIVLSRSLPVSQGIELMMAQRDKVHGAWEVPREKTMSAFFSTHPEWKNTPPLPQGFHWKWYFAFHQVGDENVAEQVQHYRNGLLARQRWTERLAWLLPGVATQGVLHHLAATDQHAQLAYQDATARFHQQIRAFYYPYLFNDRLFGLSDFAQRPVFLPHHVRSAGWTADTLVLMLISVLMLGLGLRSLRWH
ncbi:ABC transporter permease [Pseudomonas putida]|uniref:ABC transporter permease n=1 Tax=Pseudomonas putida TaxID=303 RepID=UPI0023664E68|nr:DUF3526 domain-containing protein [Pseudomonas putida]MDD2047797.1 DUF3526 domain-containing protein [Pseudomonas putida]